MTTELNDDFNIAGDQINALLDEMEQDGHDIGAVMGGALTALLFRLMVQSPDGNTTMGMLSSAMNQAAVIAAEYDMINETKH
jgi:hypothetical protein|tara:strand:- start:294 stop:539 length:246 start_codon:yes stop_codon:yes gene_type:complete